MPNIDQGKSNIKWIKKNNCKGCNGFRCVANQFASTSTAQPYKEPPIPSCPLPKQFPEPSPYFVAPYPPSWHRETVKPLSNSYEYTFRGL